jgi:hypothetical protein
MVCFERNYKTGRGPKVRLENSEKNLGGEAIFHQDFPKTW